MLLLISRAVEAACKQAVAEKLEGARELSEKEAAEAVCQVFTNSLEYEPLMPVASACGGSGAQQGLLRAHLRLNYAPFALQDCRQHAPGVS